MSENAPGESALFLPGDIDDTLLRYCSPVQFRRGGGCPGVVVGFVDHKGYSNTPLVWWPRDEFGVGKPSHRSSVCLDLTDTTGRHHFDLWLERALYGGTFCEGEIQHLQRVITSDEYEYDSGGGRVGIREYGYACWYIGDMAFAAPECGPESITAEIPGLAEVDIRSARLLGDKSRWADAAARVAIGKHIAGMSDFTGWRSLVPEWDGGPVEELIP